jgi:trk system potassium uptake protein TrkA
MNIIVVGCGRVGAEVAYGLFSKGHKITVVDQDAGAFRNLPEDFRGMTLQGDVLTHDILLRAGIEHADALAAVTPNDSVNTVLGHIARVVFNVPNVVVRNFDPRKSSMHGAFGLQVISPVSMGAQRIEEILSGELLHCVYQAGDGTVEIYQMSVPKVWHGAHLHELVPQEQYRVVSLTRGGRSALPKPDTQVESGDILHISTTREAAQALRERLEKLRKD